MKSEKTVQFAPVNTGKLDEIPPDLPAGAWEAQCSVKKMATAKDSYPMLCLEWKTTEALTDGNEDQVGGRATDFIVFFPSTHKAARMGKVRLKTMCDALGVEIPAVSKVSSWDDLAPLIEGLDGCKAKIYTTIEERKDTGEQVTKVRYTAPGASMRIKAAAAVEDDEEEAPKKKFKKKHAA